MMKKHIIDGLEFENDIHSTVENADFTALDRLYRGRKAYFGDFHCHTNSGGTSDGRFPPEAWLAGLKEYKMDFVGIMDHKQIRHMYLESFDPEYIVCGSEPGGSWNEPHLGFHYLMIVPERECLKRVIEKFPDVYEFTGGEEGTFVYKRIERERFLEIVKAIRSEGGNVIHAHPKQTMKSDDPSDFYFGEGTGIEIIYTKSPFTVANEDTKKNYRLWMDMLDRGFKVINTATSDSHYQTMLLGLNTVYSAEKHGRAYVEYLHRGDINAGFFGIKMCVGGYPMGSTGEYREGMELLIKIEDAHPYRFDKDETYRLDVLSDKGLVYSSVIELPFKVAIKAERRRFYRAVVIRESDGAPAAIGNPVWF